MVETSKATIDVGKMPVLNLYETEVRQLFQNLITNAIKFQSKDTKPEIRIRSERRSNYWEFSVSDNGIGIDISKYHDRLFGMYKTFHGNKDARGIGLFITKNQIDAMGGKVEVFSEVNVGTTFKITFS